MAEQLGNGKEKCLGCGGRGQNPPTVHPILPAPGVEPQVFPGGPCEECGGTGEVPTGTDPLTGSQLDPTPPAVPESQEVLKQNLDDEIERLEALALGEPPSQNPGGGE